MDEWTRQQYEIEVALQHERIRLQREQKRRDALNAIQHGHSFGDIRQCKCGLADKQYLALPSALREVCRLSGLSPDV